MKNCLLLCSLWLAFSAQAQPTYSVQKLQNGVSTYLYDESSPVLSRDGKSLYFTRTASPNFNRTLIEDSLQLHQTMNEDEYMRYLSEIFSSIAGTYIHDPVRSHFNQDIWVARLDDRGEVVSVHHPTYPLNNALPNSVAALTPYDGELILVNQFPAGGGMNKGYSVTNRINDSLWSAPRPIHIMDYDNIGSDVTMCISGDGSVIVYSMMRDDLPEQWYDLFISFLQPNGTWSSPQRLPEPINTHRDELTPYLSEDDERLFFASDRNSTFDSRDLFVSHRLDDSWTRWSQPKPLIAPLNSSADDTQPYFDVKTGYLLFASNREGSQDIYRVQIAAPNPVTVKVKGQVYHANTLQPLGATITAGPEKSVYGRALSVYESEDGSFKLSIRKGKEMRIEATRTGYLPASENFHFKRSNFYSKTYEIQLFLEPIQEGMRFEIETLYFQQSKPEILEVSYPSLDQLATFLKVNPSVSIHLIGHTDNVGRAEDLLALSVARSQAVKSYLVKEAQVEEARIRCSGRGAAEPLTDNSTENLRAKNRRVEVIIENIQ